RRPTPKKRVPSRARCAAASVPLARCSKKASNRPQRGGGAGTSPRRQGMKNLTVVPSNERHANFLKSLESFSKGHRAADWSGTFGAFLESIFPKNPPGMVRSSHQYVWDMLRSEGLADDTGQLHCRVFEDELYGIEGTIDRLVDYFKAASAGSEVGRR